MLDDPDPWQGLTMEAWAAEATGYMPRGLSLQRGGSTLALLLAARLEETGFQQTWV